VKGGKDKMNKITLVEYVSERTGVTKKDAHLVVNTCLEGIKHGLVYEGRVTLSGLGTFLLSKRMERKARNPKTGEKIDVQAKVVPKFKASGQLKEAVAEEWK